MKIIIVTQNIPIFIPKIISLISKKYSKYLDLLVFLEPDEYKNPIKECIYYLRFWGLKQSIKIVKTLIENIIRKRKKSHKKIKTIKNISVNSNWFINKAKEADYIISIAANQIFKKEILKAPKRCCINIHAGLLPKYRGFNPSFWALYNNEKTTGVTFHKMVEDLDAGPILIQKTLKINPKETWFSLQNRVAELAGKILIEGLPLLLNEKLNFKKQSGKMSKFFRPEIKHGKDFRQRGKRFI